MDNSKSAQVKIPEELHTKIKIYSAKNKMTIPEIMIKATKMFLVNVDESDEEYLTKEEVRELFSECLNRLK